MTRVGGAIRLRPPHLPDAVLRELVAADLEELCPHEAVAREYAFRPPRRFRFDLAVPALRIAVEFQGFWGGGHAGPEGFYRDAEKYCLAAAEGWLVFPVPYRTVRESLPGLRLLLRQAVERRRAGDGPGKARR